MSSKKNSIRQAKWLGTSNVFRKGKATAALPSHSGLQYHAVCCVRLIAKQMRTWVTSSAHKRLARAVNLDYRRRSRKIWADIPDFPRPNSTKQHSNWTLLSSAYWPKHVHFFRFELVLLETCAKIFRDIFLQISIKNTVTLHTHAVQYYTSV
jgi:hypothetical protein